MAEPNNTAQESTWVTFKYAEIKEANATKSKFALLRVAENFTDYGRIDEKFFPLVEKQLEDLKQGIFTDLRCYPDPYKGEGNWRLDDAYYQKLNAELNRISLESLAPTPDMQPPAPAEPERISVTFSIDKADHAFLKALHERIRQADKKLKTFESYNSHLYTKQLDLLRSTLPELDTAYPKLPEDIPF